MDFESTSSIPSVRATVAYWPRAATKVPPRFASAPLSLADGRLVEFGSPDQLLSREGLFSTLFARQAAAFQTVAVE
jgi:hypothetical protein